MPTNQERLNEIIWRKLCIGNGVDINSACAMQMVSYVGNEAWSDQPECACQILTRYVILLNDRFNDVHRQLLKPFISLLVGTRESVAVQVARKRFLRFRYVTVVYPLLLDARGLSSTATQLRSYQNTLASMALASTFLDLKTTELKNNAGTSIYASAYFDADTNAHINARVYAAPDVDPHTNSCAGVDIYTYAGTWQGSVVNTLVESLWLAIAITGKDPNLTGRARLE